MIARPQPLGALPWPAGMLIVPDGPIREGLLRGIFPDDWPEEWAFVRDALSGDAARAAAGLTGSDDVSAYNRAVLVGGEGAWDPLADAAGDLAVLRDVAMYSVGATDDVPEAGAASGEIAAMAHSARASAALAEADAGTALDELALGAQTAAEAGSMILAASMHATRAELWRDALGQPERAVEDVDAALRLIPRMVDDSVRVYAPAELWGELHMTRALARQELSRQNPGLLLAVTQDLNEALKVFTEDEHPEQFAACNSHLALAYLVMPMSDNGDRLRVGVAVTSLRAALRVYQPDTHPALWSSTQLNLANALQYLPSVHQEENLDEAVQLYEQLLSHRDEQRDPAGVARILLNQGNALGHLGVFSDARERLTRARDLFTHVGDTEAAATADELLANVETAAAGAR